MLCNKLDKKWSNSACTSFGLIVASKSIIKTFYSTKKSSNIFYIKIYPSKMLSNSKNISIL